MKKTKVCVLQNGFRHGGTDTFVINLCRGIDKSKFEVSIINPCNIFEKNILEGEVLKLGIPVVHTAGLDSKKSLLKHLWQLYKYLKANKIDTFHTNVDLFNGPQLLVAKLAGVKNRVCHSHNTMQNKQIVKSSFLITIYQKVMKWLCWACSTRQTGCSEAAMEFLFQGRPWDKQSINPIVFNGIDIDKYKLTIDVEAKKRELGLTAQYNIVTVGRIFPQKNPIFLLNVFNEYSKRISDCDLVWVGIGEQQTEVKNIAKEYGIDNRIHFLGARNDVAEIMKCCDLFLLPSKFEGLGIVLIEAQASGLPCIASDVVPKLANCGGVTYLSLDKPLDIWADTIVELLAIDNKNINGEQLEKFSIQNMCKQLEQIFTI